MRIGKRRISKRLVLILVPVVIVLGGTGAALAAGTLPFTDISGNAHEQSIANMADRGVTTGYPDGTFRPDQPVTRGQMMTYLDRYTSGMGCTDCHDETSLITGKATAWEESLHATGEAYVRSSSAGCAGCHSGGAFSVMVAAGQNPTQVKVGDPDPTRQDCRACHQIHTSYTGDDWALETTAAVAIYALPGNTYDGGAGNLCATCHEPRTAFPAAVGGKVNVSSTHWGPHHGPQSAMLMGIGGAGATTGAPSSHYKYVDDTCVTCHMGTNDAHSFEPSVAACTPCHSGATDFDIDDAQTEVQGMLDNLKTALVAKGLLTADGSTVVGEYPEAQAAALWNWIFVNNEDKSLGVHNPSYTKALLQASLDALK